MRIIKKQIKSLFVLLISKRRGIDNLTYLDIYFFAIPLRDNNDFIVFWF